MMYVRIPVQNRKSVTTRTLKVIGTPRVLELEQGTYITFLGRRVRRNADGTVSTYGADHSYLTKATDMTEVEL